jgi:hypothetical protein
LALILAKLFIVMNLLYYLSLFIYPPTLSIIL